MSSPRLPLSSRPAFLPDEISRREFATVFRGYDPAEVRTFLNQLAEQSSENADRIAEIQKALANTEQQVKNPELDEETVTRLLGEQTAQILRSAREAANEMRSKAEDEVSAQLRNAHEVTTRMREEAETLLAERTEEAERMAETVRTEAAEAADATRRRASEDASNTRAEAAEDAERMRREAAEDAADQRAQAQRQAQELVDTARRESEALVTRTREQQAELLEGIIRKRKIALAQVEELRAGRQRLLQAYKLVRSSLDEVTAELERVEAEARQSAEQAGVQAAESTGISANDLDENIEMESIELGDDVPSSVIDLIEGGDATADEPMPTGNGPQLFDAQATGEEFDGGMTPSATATATMERMDAPASSGIIDVEVVESETTVTQTSAFHFGEASSAMAMEDDSEMARRRNEALEKNRSQALRRLRRTMQEEQDAVVSRLRGGNGDSVQALLGSVDDQAVSYQRAVEKVFREVARSGAHAVPGSIGGDAGLLDSASASAASSLALELVEDLRAQLVPVIDEILSSDLSSDASSVQSLVNDSYGLVRGDYLDSLVEDRLHGVFDQGVALARS